MDKEQYEKTIQVKDMQLVEAQKRFERVHRRAQIFESAFHAATRMLAQDRTKKMSAVIRAMHLSYNEKIGKIQTTVEQLGRRLREFHEQHAITIKAHRVKVIEVGHEIVALNTQLQLAMKQNQAMRARLTRCLVVQDTTEQRTIWKCRECGSMAHVTTPVSDLVHDKNCPLYVPQQNS